MQSIKDEASPAISKESSPAPAVVAKTKKEAGQEVAAEQKKPGKPAPVPIKREKSDLFKAFAKSQPKVKREETGSSSASRSASRPVSRNFDPVGTSLMLYRRLRMSRKTVRP